MERSTYISARCYTYAIGRFDNNGTRLGYGGGYYDTTISNLKKNKGRGIVVIGIAREIQRVKFIPIQKMTKSLIWWSLKKILRG